MSEGTVTRFRATDGSYIGTTAFFRNRPFLKQLGREFAASARAGRPAEALIHACSVGAEVYTLAIHMALEHPDVDYRIYATDASRAFAQHAALATYPVGVLASLSAEERACFHEFRPGQMTVDAAITARVQILEPASFVDFDAGRSFDVVTLCNALVYVPREKQAEAIRRIARYNTGVLAVTGFHPDSIAKDLADNAYEPIMDGFHDIHDSWLDRRRPKDVGVVLPSGVYADPYIDPVDDGPDWRYRHGALFRKRAAAAAA